MAEPRTLAIGAGEAELQVEWDLDAITRQAGQEGAPSWRLAQKLDWTGIESLRLLSASFEDESVLCLAALRPTGVNGHGDESVSAIVCPPSGEEIPIDHTLLSTEYGPAGEITRIGLELHLLDDDIPMRGAGDICQTGARTGDGPARIASTLEIRLDGMAGIGLLETLTGPA